MPLYPTEVRHGRGGYRSRGGLSRPVVARPRPLPRLPQPVNSNVRLPTPANLNLSRSARGFLAPPLNFNVAVEGTGFYVDDQGNIGIDYPREGNTFRPLSDYAVGSGSSSDPIDDYVPEYPDGFRPPYVNLGNGIFGGGYTWEWVPSTGRPADPAVLWQYGPGYGGTLETGTPPMDDYGGYAEVDTYPDLSGAPWNFADTYHAFVADGVLPGLHYTKGGYSSVTWNPGEQPQIPSQPAREVSPLFVVVPVPVRVSRDPATWPINRPVEVAPHGYAETLPGPGEQPSSQPETSPREASSTVVMPPFAPGMPPLVVSPPVVSPSPGQPPVPVVPPPQVLTPQGNGVGVSQPTIPPGGRRPPRGSGEGAESPRKDSGLPRRSCCIECRNGEPRFRGQPLRWSEAPSARRGTVLSPRLCLQVRGDL